MANETKITVTETVSVERPGEEFRWKKAFAPRPDLPAATFIPQLRRSGSRGHSKLNFPELSAETLKRLNGGDTEALDIA